MRTTQSLLDQIDERLMKIHDNPEFFTARAELIEKGLRYLGDLHSFWLEHPSLRRKLLLDNKASDEREIKEIAKKGIKQIRRAWKYLTSEQFKESNCGILGYLTPEVIGRVGKYVEPGKNHSGFRETHVKSPFPVYTPYSSMLVPRMIEELCNDIRSKSSEHPVELAAEVHMRIAGIQPFVEGNKRTARLFERRVLEGYGFPTALIPYGEREHYLGVLISALYGFKEGNIEAQTPFFNYIGGKVATGLDKIIDDLEVDFVQLGDKGIVDEVKNYP